MLAGSQMGEMREHEGARSPRGGVQEMLRRRPVAGPGRTRVCQSTRRLSQVGAVPTHCIRVGVLTSCP
jgi:hypothetical protein